MEELCHDLEFSGSPAPWEHLSRFQEQSTLSAALQTGRAMQSLDELLLSIKIGFSVL